MKKFCFISTLVVFSFAVANAQTKRDEEALRRVPKEFSEAWAKHDGHELAQIMSDDVDFVTVGATWFHGRRDFETYHTRLLSGRFKDSTLTPLETAVRFLRPDLAVLHWSWAVQGDKNPDGSPRTPRFGLMAMIAEKRKGRWLVVTAQNTNGLPNAAPEEEGITMPIVVPRPAPEGPRKL